MRFLGGIGQELKYYMVVFKVLRYGSYIEDVMVEATDAKKAKQIGEKMIRGRFAPRTKMEFVEVYEVKNQFYR